LLNAKDGSLKQLRKDVCSRHEPVTSLLEDGVLVVEEWALIEFENHHIKNHTNAAINTSLTQKEKTTYLNIIGGLLELMLGETPAGNKQSVFKDNTAIINALLAHHDGKQGISKRTLESKFAAAKRSLDSDP
jgi:hypothetical protein